MRISKNAAYLKRGMPHFFVYSNTVLFGKNNKSQVNIKKLPLHKGAVSTWFPKTNKVSFWDSSKAY